MDQSNPMRKNNPMSGFIPLGPSFRGFEDDSELSDVNGYVFFDWDSFRSFDVKRPYVTGTDWEAWQRQYEADPEFVDRWEESTAGILRPIVDDLPPAVTAIDFSQSGKLLRTVSDPACYSSHCTYYPSTHEYQLPAPLPTLLRSDLAVVQRFGCADKVVYANGKQEKVAAFKYNPVANVCGGCVWPEIQIQTRLAPHPHILAIESLVLEEISGQGVVGFTMPFIPTGTLEDNVPRLFKLRWLRELMHLVDELHFEYGIAHQDIEGRNLFISDTTDSILLFDFGWAAQIGTTHDARYVYRGEVPKRNDVKGTMFFLYRFITRDPQYRIYYLDEADEGDIMDRAKWVKHADVELDHDVETFYNELMAWVRKRRDGLNIITHYTEAPRHFEIPDPPINNVAGYQGRGHSKHRIQAGLPVVMWERPPASKVDKSRKLLATGRYADEQPPVCFIPVPDPKMGFPQKDETNTVLRGEDGQQQKHAHPMTTDAVPASVSQTAERAVARNLQHLEVGNAMQEIQQGGDASQAESTAASKKKTRVTRRTTVLLGGDVGTEDGTKADV
ncbi:hypothetical protein B0T25DRAFT_550328 [Lasiosphaeria hispida]|uniref:Protein kinase domain-containing protein n=1 Tax=Lasiosphaeria hispida TaxID=260671 RepID=A0AAJ0HGD1_9PEZI|nr:hypothetical protein B0T25DRAFT_550328 [Lasiosphaeria hispida]